jgi:hypothetical protein
MAARLVDLASQARHDGIAEPAGVTAITMIRTVEHTTETLGALEAIPTLPAYHLERTRLLECGDLSGAQALLAEPAPGGVGLEMGLKRQLVEAVVTQIAGELERSAELAQAAAQKARSAGYVLYRTAPAALKKMPAGPWMCANALPGSISGKITRRNGSYILITNNTNGRM